MKETEEVMGRKGQEFDMNTIQAEREGEKGDRRQKGLKTQKSGRYC